MWLIAEFEAVTLFSLKLSSATSSGGKTLLVPTPYAIKMALLDASFRTLGVIEAEERWPEVRDLRVAILPSETALVTNLFQRVLRPRRRPAEPGDPDAGPFQKTIGYREYVQLIGSLGMALGWTGDERRSWLADLVLSINYLGKRGGFIQLITLPEFQDQLPEGYVVTTSEQSGFMIYGTLQRLDDCGSSLTFDKANIYSRQKVVRDSDRIIRNIVLPYRLIRSSKSFSLYKRISPDQATS